MTALRMVILESLQDFLFPCGDVHCYREPYANLEYSRQLLQCFRQDP